MKKICLIFLACLCLCGCGNSKNLERVESETETEIVYPETTDETSRALTYLGKSYVYTIRGTEVFSSSCDRKRLIIYENAESFNYVTIDIAYMPNYETLQKAGSDLTFKELEDGTVLYLENYGVEPSVALNYLNNIK